MRFYGAIGYGMPEERIVDVEGTPTKTGIWDKTIVERSYFGDVIRNTRQLREGSSPNDDITVQNSLSIVADAYASEHFHVILYAKWAGVFWKVEDVDASQRPRLVLRLGGVYDGPTAEAPEEADGHSGE